MMHLVHKCRTLHFFMGYIQAKTIVICAQEGCSLQLKSYAGFRKHLNACHSTVKTGRSNIQTPHQSDLAKQSSQEETPDMVLDMTL